MGFDEYDRLIMEQVEMYKRQMEELQQNLLLEFSELKKKLRRRKKENE